MRSAGTRSGVNWMRWKSPPIVWATVLMAIVLANPGTPSTSTWPRASRATINRSSSMSWPTSSFFTWKTTCSIGAILGGGMVTGAPRSRSLLRCAGRAPGSCDRNGKAEADEELLVGRIRQGGDDPDDLSGTVQQWAAGVTGIDRGVELDEAFQRASCRDGHGTVQSGHHSRREGIV